MCGDMSTPVTFCRSEWSVVVYWKIAFKGLRVSVPRSLDIAQQFLQPTSQTHIHSPGLSEGEGLAGKQDGHRKRVGRHDVGFRGVPLLPTQCTCR